MAKLIKSILRLIVVLLVLIVAGVIAVDLLADGAVRNAVERAGTKALKVDLQTGRAKLSILGGSLHLEDVVVGNPEGYQTDRLMTVKDGDIEVNARSLLGDEIHIKEIQLRGVDVLIEQKGLGSNLHEVLKTLSEEVQSEKQLYVDRLEITDITVEVKLMAVPGQVDKVPLKLSPIVMTNLGRDERMDTAALVGKIVLALAGGIAEQGAGILPKGMIDSLGTVLDTAIDIGRIIFGTRKEEIENIGKGITEGLKGLLKPQDQQQP